MKSSAAAIAVSSAIAVRRKPSGIGGVGAALGAGDAATDSAAAGSSTGNSSSTSPGRLLGGSAIPSESCGDSATDAAGATAAGARRIGSISWDITQRHVPEALLLTDEAIRAAQLWLWKELKLAVEPAAALPLAALQSGAYSPRDGETVCLIVCGANVDPATLA